MITIDANGRNAILVPGDCVEVMKLLPESSVDAIVCDPPYGLEFMGKEFDKLGEGMAQQKWHEAWAVEALRVLKPGGYLLAFGGTRTYHRLASAVEDAGFEIRDSVIWCQGQGFPKNMDISKAIDKSAGTERTETRPYIAPDGKPRPTVVRDWAYADARGEANGQNRRAAVVSAPATEDAKKWDGWGTALKPAFEPVVVARKPLIGTVAANVLKHGTGGLNIDSCRIPARADELVEDDGRRVDMERGTCAEGYDRPNATMFRTGKPAVRGGPSKAAGRFPANLLLSHSPSCVHLDSNADTDLWACVPGCPIRAMDAQSDPAQTDKGVSRYFMRFDPADAPFIYAPKANKKERNDGVEGGNKHPTVKPVAVMAYLCRLVTPPGGRVLDPFMGSGTTGIAALREGFDFIGIERESEYREIAEARIRHAMEPK